MILLNFSHPITDAQRAQIESLAGSPLSRLIEIMPQFANGEALQSQIAALADRAGLSPRAWQTEALIVNLPGLAPAAAGMLAEIHGRIGHFPSILRLAPRAGANPPAYDVVEIINLQAWREDARTRRAG